MNAKHVEFLISQLNVLVVDDNAYMRNIVRSLLTNIGVKKVYEAPDGIAGLELIRAEHPDMVILDWEMPMLNGPEFVRIVRSPGVFPFPDIPIIMLTAHGERWRIVEAVRLGVNEFLCKPVSAKSLHERFVSILLKPRASVQLGEYYGPAPRKAGVETDGLNGSDAKAPPAGEAETAAPPVAPEPEAEPPAPADDDKIVRV